MPPGEYTAFAFPDRAGYTIEDPKYRRKFTRFGEKVEVKAGDTVALNLRLLPTLDQLDREGLR